MESICQFIGSSTLGMFGAGHLGRAIARGLLEAGFPRHRLIVCHRGSAETQRRLVEAGLSECAADCSEVVSRSRILLYVVRPQDYRSLADYVISEDCLLVSFLAGVSLERIPAPLDQSQRVRIMTSAPDTLRRKDGIAALHPGGNVIAREILATLGLRIFPLQQEADIHAFTAMGPCLPIALTYWEGLGYKADEHELLDTAAGFGIPQYSQILDWARRVQPGELSAEERERYITQATTPGGVTEAILEGIRTDRRLSAALVRGIHRSRELAAL